MKQQQTQSACPLCLGLLQLEAGNLPTDDIKALLQQQLLDSEFTAGMFTALPALAVQPMAEALRSSGHAFDQLALRVQVRHGIA